MTRILQRTAQPVAILVPVLFTVATFYRTRAIAALETSLAEAFAALLWFSLIHVPLYFAARLGQRSWPTRAAVAGLLLAPTALMAAIVWTGVTRTEWASFAGAAAWGGQYLLALTSLVIHSGVLTALLWPNPPLERTVPAV